MSAVLTVSSSSFPYGAAAIAAHNAQVTLRFSEDILEPVLEAADIRLTVESDIILHLAQANRVQSRDAKVTSFVKIATALTEATDFQTLVGHIEYLDSYLAYRTLLLANEVSAADWVVWGALKGSSKVIGAIKAREVPHLKRWIAFIDSLPSSQAALTALVDARAAKARLGSKTASSFALGFPNATMGNVVTRFPPEPSGYLHIGHAKAALLNQYFAKMYQGKLIIRFDDTNPSKEKTEFEDTILEDLQLLGITGDRVTHTSDYFQPLLQLAKDLIHSGQAYADDIDSTIQKRCACSCPSSQHAETMTEMAYQRWHGISSARRDATVGDNLAQFEKMCTGSDEGQRWCIRAKISIDDPNKAMRDPVIYRCNITPHHRTGTDWKVYPTYDFSCPIVDSLEGVTHALRTDEYRDRNAQYAWMLKASNARNVDVWDFSRLNFIYTLLSKRKLHWFVDQGLVRGWDDPRFPTVRGIRRRGLTITALSQFMLSQGPSSSVVSLEWDSLWSLNKKVIDPIAPRYWALVKSQLVPVVISGGPNSPEYKELPILKKNPTAGTKRTTYTSQIYIEQEDAVSLSVGEEITLMDWGNAIVRAIVVSDSADETRAVRSLQLDLHLAGDFRKTKKKLTWLGQSPDVQLVDIILLDYDYLITKKKLETTDDVKDFVPPQTEFVEAAVSDAAHIGSLVRGDIIQFERKGFYIHDGIRDDLGGAPVFISIPDGRSAGVASKASLAAGRVAQVASTAQSGMYKMTVPYPNDLTALPGPLTSMYSVTPMYNV